MDRTLEILREVTRGSCYEGRLYLVGGVLRDRLLESSATDEAPEPNNAGKTPIPDPSLVKMEEEDIDIVLEGDACKFAQFLFENDIAERPPVTYPRFGTAMITISGRQVELVGARKESYEHHSRKPKTEPGTLLDDVLRRDFTINTLLQNLHTGEVKDLTGMALRDLQDRIIRTPKDPRVTFEDDPLRMLRAVRFAARLGFNIHPDTYAAICEMAHRLEIVSAERIRDEFIKILMCENATWGLETLRETGLLEQFAPELAAMHGVTQNIYHIYDVWTHTLKTLESIRVEEGIILRLSALLHDVGKVETRTVDEDGSIHFYRHQTVGARIARRLMQRLRFSVAQIERVAFLISMHLRVGEYDKQWTDAAVRRLIRDAGDHLEDAIRLTEADKAAANPNMPSVDIAALREHIGKVKKEIEGKRLTSPLSGREIMEALGLEPGPQIGKIKAFLEGEVIEGRLAPGDKTRAREMLVQRYGSKG
ncbi:MAG: CCA tRNA nucleotidyltransferase [Armatimonadetes bacterium]|nr:CCA tRNA nucleotidyltransferase [Armatimonadota bacterium]